MDTLRGFQAQDGLFREESHDPLHTTAHCLAALELFDANASRGLRALAGLREPRAVAPFLDGLDWSGQPWTESHRGAGAFAALHLAGEATPAWTAAYCAWLDAEQDPRTGLLRRGSVPDPSDVADGDPRLFPHLAGTFHYLFNLEHLGQGLRHPAALVDTCLEIEQRALFPFSRFVGFAEIDWVYCLHRALRQSGHRSQAAHGALRRFAARHLRFLETLDPELDPGLDDLHNLFGTVCALAELQAALPGELRSEAPLQRVLDRRPFI